ncbi:MAG: EamA family transporter [Solirubrobacterales bacterium]|jgi:drug/metabolite transporter (DMT)-like permease|nr:EamA family transporter [Solirubrobacterales bacterium]OJU95920.1 MAG: hypothetical protein BGO23_10110 [Solirubrobacterales bacterium 67-14]
MTSSRRYTLIGVLMTVGAAFCFGSMPTFAKISYDHGANAIGLLTARYLTGSILILGYVAMRRGLTPLGRGHQYVGMLAAIFCVQSFCFFQSLDLTSTVITVLLLYTYPLIVTGLSVAFLGERLGPIKMLILLVGVFGVCLTLGGIEGHPSVPGISLALLSGILFAIFLVLSKRRLEDYFDPIETAGLIYAYSTVVFGLFMVPAGGSMPSDTTGWLAFGGVVLVGTVASMTLFLSGLERLPAGVTSMLSTLEPAVAVTLAAVFLDEGLGTVQVFGISLVITAIASLGYLLLRNPVKEAELEGD